MNDAKCAHIHISYAPEKSDLFSNQTQEVWRCDVCEIRIYPSVDNPVYPTQEYVDQLKSLLNDAKEALIWCGGADDFALEGKARKGWERGPKLLIGKITEKLKI